MADNFLTWWSRKCGRNWAILGSIVAGLIAMITLYNLARPVVAEMRPWATRYELSQVAERTYQRAVTDQIAITKSLEAKLEYLKALARDGKMSPEQWIEIPVIEQAIQKSKEEETRIIKERAYFEMQKEYR